MSTNYKIPLVIIEVPNGGRSATLIEQLKYSSLFDVIIFKAIMYSDEQKILYAPNINKQKLVYDRYLSFGEIGSTISHDLVYKQLIKFIVLLHYSHYLYIHTSIKMSIEVEETIKRIQSHKGVKGGNKLI